MRKKGMALLLSVAMVFSMTACSTKDNSGETTKTPAATESASDAKPSTDSGEKTVITVWTNNRHDSEYMESKIAEFNETNTDGIQIEYVIQTDNWSNMLTMAASSGQAPDVMSVQASDAIDLQTFVDAGIYQPINKYLTDEYKKVNEIDNVLYEGLNKIGDDIYWIPCGMRSGSRLIYNEDLFKAANAKVPTTLDELVQAASEITAAGNGKSYGVIFPGQSSPFSRWLEGSAELSGVTAYDYANGVYNFDGFKPILEATKKMFEDGSTFPGTATMKIDPIRAQFAEGNVGIHGNASQEVGVLTQQFPMKGNWGVADLPTVTGTVEGALSISPNNAWAISGSTEHPDLAWKVIEYFGSEDFLKGYLEGGYTLPISEYMASRIDSSKTGRLADFALKDYEDVYPTAPAVTPEGETYRDALWNACLPGGPDIDETIAKLNKSYNEALDSAVSMGKVKRLVVENFDPKHPSAGTCTYLDK